MKPTAEEWWGRSAEGARLNGIQEVPGSTPGGSTNFSFACLNPYRRFPDKANFCPSKLLFSKMKA